jgi:thioredoxin 1
MKSLSLFSMLLATSVVCGVEVVKDGTPASNTSVLETKTAKSPATKADVKVEPKAQESKEKTAPATPAIIPVASKAALRDILATKGPKVFKFYADWCPPCKSIEKVITKLAQAYSDKVKVYAINADNPEFKDFMTEQKISGLPTIVFVSSGVTLAGARSEQEYEAAFKKETAAQQTTK